VIQLLSAHVAFSRGIEEWWLLLGRKHGSSTGQNVLIEPESLKEHTPLGNPLISAGSLAPECEEIAVNLNHSQQVSINKLHHISAVVIHREWKRLHIYLIR